MAIQTTPDRTLADARDDRDLRQISDAADTTTQPTQDSMVQLVRQGQDASLRSLQVWADLARKLGSTALSDHASATMLCLAHDPFEKLLEAQRQIVDELVATQRQFVQQGFPTATVGGNRIPGRRTSR